MTQSSRVLATRCPHCHTVFRVVADQLKLRDGLVRCGNCREVFDGRTYLCEPPNDEIAGDSPAAPGTPETPEAAPAVPDTPAATDTDGSPGTSAPTAPAAGPAHTRPPVPEMLTPTAIAALLGAPDESRAQMQHGPGRYMDDDLTALRAPTTAPAYATPQPPKTSTGGRDRATRHGAARVAWRALFALAIIGLLAQWTWLERAALVDRVPALRGVLAAIGRPLHVTVAPPRQPDMIQISGVTLVTDAPDANATNAATSDATADAASEAAADPTARPNDTVPMTLTVFIRNQADHALAWPSLELTLSDIDGKPVVRRVFAASDYVADAALRDAGLAPRNERTIRLRLSAQAALASNYRVLAFYP